MYARMRGGWPEPETICGTGAFVRHTEKIRGWIPAMCAYYKIASLNDAGAGDRNWSKLIEWEKFGIMYRGFDLIPRLPEITQVDITSQALPPAQAVLCRIVLNHLPDERIARALDLFRESHEYLFATQYDDNDSGYGRQFRRINMKKWLGRPVEILHEKAQSEIQLGLWRL